MKKYLTLLVLFTLFSCTNNQTDYQRIRCIYPTGKLYHDYPNSRDWTLIDTSGVYYRIRVSGANRGITVEKPIEVK
jgi:hypothetical protein